MDVVISLVQLASAVSVVLAPCPVYEQSTSCYVPQTRTIYVAPAVDRDSRLATALHEYGHAWDFDHPEMNRERLKRLMGFPASRQWWGRGVGLDDMSPAERFANAYMACALGRPTIPIWTGRLRVRRICSLLPKSIVVRWRGKVFP